MDLVKASGELKELLKDRSIMLANWGCADKDTFQCRDWIPIFKKVFKETSVFSFRNHYYFYGKKQLNKNFLEILEKLKHQLDRILLLAEDPISGKLDQEKTIVGLLDIVPFDDKSRKSSKEQLQKIKNKDKTKDLLLNIINGVHKTREKAVGEKVMRQITIKLIESRKIIKLEDRKEIF